MIAITVMTMNALSGLFCAWVFYQIYTMGRSYKAGHISQHPLFQNCPSVSDKPEAIAQRDDMGGYFRVNEDGV